MGPIKFNLSVGLMVCLLTTATLVIGVVPVGHATVDGGDGTAIANRKLTADGGHREQPPSKPTALGDSATATQSCREACSEKFSTKESVCSQRRDCSTFSTKESVCSQRRDCSTCQRKCILENLTPASRNSSHRLALVLLQMIRNESLVTADVAWVSAAWDSRTPRTNRTRPPQQQQQQCLVTWEVSGGGLMGNLLTESSAVQLSLWPDTNYRVQVTCRNKQTEALVRSAPIVLNTSGATAVLQGHSKRPETGSEGDGEAIAPEGSTQEVPPAVVVRGTAVVPHGGGSSYRDTVLFGVYFAMLMFLIVLLAVISFVRPKSVESSAVGFGKCDDPVTEASDRAVLVQNDVMAKQAAAVEILHV